MTNKLKTKLMLGVAMAVFGVSTSSLTARADDAMLREVLARLDKLEHENAKLRAKVENQDGKIAKVKKANEDSYKAPAAAPVATSVAVSAPPIASDDGWYIHKKDGPGLTFQTPGGEISMYGQIDLSADATTKGIKNVQNANGTDRPIGNLGWQPAISSNLSLIGIRGYQKLDDIPFKFLYQLETQIDVSVNSGLGTSNSNQSYVVRGGLTTRDSFVGLENAEIGAIKIGKSEAPYKKATDIFNPFNGMLGDYRVVMGNSGGDNRVEFMTRMEHSIWWESPNWNGLKLAALFSPGQNRASDSSNVASGSSDCAGGNAVVSGGADSCTDGAFSDAISASATYTTGNLLLMAAYERHEKVNRSSDIDPAGIFNGFQSADVVPEDAFKAGALYKFPTNTTVGGFWERMNRYVPASLAAQNERTRDGTWFFLTQDLSPKDQLSFGWAHAFATPGDPGIHNTTGGSNPKNSADMLTAAYKHKLNNSLTWYTNYALTLNDRDAHYDLGAGGHGVTTDDHDAAGADGGASGNGGHGWAGGTVQGISTGLNYKF